MKKTYINPTIHTHKVVIKNIIMASPLGSQPLQSESPAEVTSGNVGMESKESTWGLDWGE